MLRVKGMISFVEGGKGWRACSMSGCAMRSALKEPNQPVVLNVRLEMEMKVKK